MGQRPNSALMVRLIRNPTCLFQSLTPSHVLMVRSLTGCPKSPSNFHPREGGGPEKRYEAWIPAFVGMTKKGLSHSFWTRSQKLTGVATLGVWQAGKPAPEISALCGNLVVRYRVRLSVFREVGVVVRWPE